jgi:hypothetical protein
LSGGWIKLEKDLLTDPRLILVAKRCNAGALHGVTHALGCIAHLWMLADTHIGNDDILPLGVHDINHVLGVKSFAEILPQDWLQVIDSNHVKLPGFHIHNGTDSKKKAQTAKRVRRHRVSVNGNALQQSNGRALPDQDQDQDQDHIRNPYPLGLDAEAWQSWVTYRIKIKKTIRPVSYPAAMRELAKHGKDQPAVIEQSIAHGWTGLFALKGPNGTAAKFMQPRSVAELEADAAK